jgi:hypothetical protein
MEESHRSGAGRLVVEGRPLQYGDDRADAAWAFPGHLLPSNCSGARVEKKEVVHVL